MKKQASILNKNGEEYYIDFDLIESIDDHQIILVKKLAQPRDGRNSEITGIINTDAILCVKFVDISE